MTAAGGTRSIRNGWRISWTSCARPADESRAGARQCDAGCDPARRAPAGAVLLMQGNLAADTTRAAAETAKARGATCVLNTAPIAWDMRAIVGLFDIVIANEGEAAQLTAGSPTPAVSLHAAGVRTAIIT